MVPDLIPQRLKTMRAVNDLLVGWDNPGCHALDAGDSDLTMYSTGPRTVKLWPNYTYPTNYKPRVWFGTNSIPYTSSFDNREIGFTFFAQINSAAKVNVFIYNTASDPEHDLNSDTGSWYMKWTENFPHNGVDPSWLYNYPDDMDLETFILSSSLEGVFTSIDIDAPKYEMDGLGFYTEDKWKVIRTNWHMLPEVSLSRNVGIFVEIEYQSPGINPEEAFSFITYPALTTRYGFVKNDVSAGFVYRALPDVIRENDTADGLLDKPLSRLLDVLTHFSDIADRFIEAWSYTDIAGGYSPDEDTQKSRLVDPSVAPLANLLWLSQFVGVKRDAVKPTSTAWSGVPGTWTQIESLVDENADTIVTWEELESYSPSFSKLVNYLRFAISTGYAGLRAGSEEAIVETVKFFLENNKVAWIDKNPVGTNRFSVTLYTYIGDTPDATGVGGTSEIVSAAIAISKPVGIEVNHVILADL